jgi:hypothetical protein
VATASTPKLLLQYTYFDELEEAKDRLSRLEAENANSYMYYGELSDPEMIGLHHGLS